MTKDTLEESRDWPSPCKLNLSLQIIGQREDGYHKLQSVFQLLDYGDTLSIQRLAADDIKFDCDIEALKGDNNLVVKAAMALKTYARQQLKKTQPLGAKIFLHKILPFGGGVGGGSSNCATTLIALNYHWQLGLSTDTLCQMGLSLGADVPIFVRGVSAFVEGIGEIITPLKLPECWYLVLQPDVQIATAKIFSNPLLTRNSKAIRIRPLDALELPFTGRNTLQEVVCKEYPEVIKALEWLKQFSPNARMTGSGSCLFIPFDNEQKVRRIATRCDWPHFVAKGVNLSPLHQSLD